MKPLHKQWFHYVKGLEWHCLCQWGHCRMGRMVGQIGFLHEVPKPKHPHPHVENLQSIVLHCGKKGIPAWREVLQTNACVQHHRDEEASQHSPLVQPCSNSWGSKRNQNIYIYTKVYSLKFDCKLDQESGSAFSMNFCKSELGLKCTIWTAFAAAKLALLLCSVAAASGTERVLARCAADSKSAALWGACVIACFMCFPSNMWSQPRESSSSITGIFKFPPDMAEWVAVPTRKTATQTTLQASNEKARHSIAQTCKWPNIKNLNRHHGLTLFQNELQSWKLMFSAASFLPNPMADMAIHQSLSLPNCSANDEVKFVGLHQEAISAAKPHWLSRSENLVFGVVAHTYMAKLSIGLYYIFLAEHINNGTHW